MKHQGLPFPKWGPGLYSLRGFVCGERAAHSACSRGSLGAVCWFWLWNRPNCVEDWWKCPVSYVPPLVKPINQPDSSSLTFLGGANKYSNWSLSHMRLSVDGHWHQFSAHSAQFGVWWRRKLFAARPLRSLTAWPWGSAAARPIWLGSGAVLLAGLLCFILVCSGCAGLLCSGDIAQPEKHSLQRKGKVCSQSHWGAGLYRQKSSTLVPDWSILMQMRAPTPCSLIGPQGIVLIGQNGVSMIGQQRCWGAVWWI